METILRESSIQKLVEHISQDVVKLNTNDYLTHSGVSIKDIFTKQWRHILNS